MKNKFNSVITKVLVVVASCLMFASFSPSLDGRAVVVDDGVFPQGLFAKTVGYLPGDIITVANISGETTVDLLVIGALDPSEGVAIMLSPEAAAALGIDKDANNIVKITKRSGQDDRVYGTAVITKQNQAAVEFEEESPIEEKSEDAFEDIEEAHAEEAEDIAEENSTEETPVEETPVEESTTEESVEAIPEETEIEETEEDFEELEEESVVPEEEITEEEAPQEEEIVEESLEPEEEIAEEEFVEEDIPEEIAEEEFTEEDIPEEYIEEDEEEPAIEEEISEELPAIEEEEAAEEEVAEEEAAIEEVPEEEAEEETIADEFVEEEATEDLAEEESPELADEEMVEGEDVQNIPEEPLEEEAVASEELPELTEAKEEVAADSFETEETEESSSEAVEEELFDEEVEEVTEEVEVVEETSEATEESESEEEYEAIVLVPVDSNPPLANEDSVMESETEEVVAETEILETKNLENVEEKTEVKSENTKTYEKTYEKYMVDGLKDLKSGSYYIQLAVLSSDDNIQSIVDKYCSNYPVTIVPTANGERKQVLIGPLGMDEYAVVLERFKSYGFKDAFLRKIK